MTARLPRLVICACALVLVLALIASQMRGSSDREARVGTEGPADGLEGDERDVKRSQVGDPTTSTTEGHIDGRAGAAGEDQRVSVAATDDDGMSSSTTLPSAAPPIPAAPSPRTLAGRIAWLELSDDPAPLDRKMQLWSMQPDGTDRRRELPECEPGAKFGGWFDVSPDGARVVVDCGVAFDSTGQSVVVQDVATGHTRPVLRAQFFDNPTVRWSPDGMRIAVASAAWLKIVDADDLEVHDVPLAGPLQSGVITWSPDGDFLLTEAAERIEVASGTVVDQFDLLDVIPAEATSWSTMARWAPDGSVYVQAWWGAPGAEQTNRLDRVEGVNGARTTIVEQAAFMGRVEFLADGRLFIKNGPDGATVIRADGTGRIDVADPWGAINWAAARGPVGLATTG